MQWKIWQGINRAVVRAKGLLINASRAIRRGFACFKSENIGSAALWLKAMRFFLVELVAVTLIVGAIVLVVWEALRDVILIEPIKVAKQLAEAGYTPDVVASQLMSHIFHIRAKSRTTMERRPLVFAGTRSDVVPPDGVLLDNVLPERWFSIRTIALYLRRVVGDHSTKVTGELIEQNGMLQFYLRIDGKRIDPLEGPRAGLEDLLTWAAHAVMRETEPYILAAYLFDTDRRAARTVVDKIIATEPEKSLTMARAYNLWGLILWKDGKLGEAIKRYKQALDINQKLPEVYNNLGDALSDDGTHDKAIKNYNEAISLNPKYAAAYSGLGITLYRKALAQRTLPSRRELLDEAIRNYREAIRVEPKQAHVHMNLGIALVAVAESLPAGQTHEAEDKFVEACGLLNKGKLLAQDKPLYDKFYRENLPRINRRLPLERQCVPE